MSGPSERTVERLQKLLGYCDAPEYERELKALVAAAHDDGFASGEASQGDEDDLALETISIELEALAARLDRAAQRSREEAEAAEHATPERAAHQHGTAAGLELAARWLRDALDRVLPDEADDAAA